MLSSIISVVIALAILGIVYVVLKWILGLIEIPFPVKVVNIVFAVIALIIVLKYLATLI